MDLNKNDSSLDEQTNYVFRKRSNLGFFTKMVATGAFLINALAGCFAKDIYYTPNPDNISAKVSTYKNDLEEIATNMGLYDSAKKQYDFTKVKVEAEKQLERDATDPSGYKNLISYNNIDPLLATMAAISKVIEQNQKYIGANLKDPSKKTDIDKKISEIKELRKLERNYDGALKRYHYLAANEIGRDEKDRKRNSLSLGVLAYAEKDFDIWRTMNKLRKKDFDSSLLDPDDSEWTAIRYPDEVSLAQQIREGKVKKNKKTFWTTFWSTIGVGTIIALCNQEDDNGSSGGGPDVGGENGGPTGR